MAALSVHCYHCTDTLADNVQAVKISLKSDVMATTCHSAVLPGSSFGSSIACCVEPAVATVCYSTWRSF